MKKKRKHRKRVTLEASAAHLPGGEWVVEVRGMEPMGANGPRGLHRCHWSVKKRTKSQIRDVLETVDLPKFEGKVSLRYGRTYRAIPMDEDNLAASLKLPLDVCVGLGIIQDDSPAHLEIVSCEQEKRAGGPPRFRLSFTPTQET